MSQKIFYITTAIDYTNGRPHLGHAYEKVLTDSIVRYRRLCGETAYLLTGVDQHGQKVQQAAEREGVEPAAYARRVTQDFIALKSALGVEADGWAETTDPRHKRAVQETLTDLHAKGEIYKATYQGHYSVRQEQFLTDKERGPDGSFGPEWGEVQNITEDNWYLRLMAHKDWLVGYIESHEDAVFPAFRRVELLNAAQRIAGDLCITRPKSRLSWGIEIPFDTDYVAYVWFDALMNYATFAGYRARPEDGLPDFASLWPPAYHVIGKDIMAPAHGIYWLIMLHALGFSDDQMPRLLVHGWWNILAADGQEEKMSKSLGNVVDPFELVAKHGSEPLRYYLLRDIATGQDSAFSEERLIQGYNSDLANGLGNLANRTLNMAHRYRAGQLRRPSSDLAGDFPLPAKAAETLTDYRQQMGEFKIHAALASVAQFVTAANMFVDAEAPWKLAKDPAQADRLDLVLYHLAESVRIAAILLQPILPEASARLLAQLQWTPPNGVLNLADATWGGLPDQHHLAPPAPVFPRIEAPKP